jgi:hypothetical protein
LSLIIVTTWGKATSALTLSSPRLLFQRLVERRAREIGIGLGEARGLDALEGVRGRHQNLGHERIRIEGNRRGDLVEHLGLEGRWSLPPRRRLSPERRGGNQGNQEQARQRSERAGRQPS